MPFSTSSSPHTTNCFRSSEHTVSGCRSLLVATGRRTGDVLREAPRDRSGPERVGGGGSAMRLAARTSASPDIVGGPDNSARAPKAYSWMTARVRSRAFWKLVRLAMGYLDVTSTSSPGQTWRRWRPLRATTRRASYSGANTGWVAPSSGTEIQELDPELVFVVSGRGYAEPFLTAGRACSPRGCRDGPPVRRPDRQSPVDDRWSPRHVRRAIGGIGVRDHNGSRMSHADGVVAAACYVAVESDSLGGTPVDQNRC